MKRILYVICLFCTLSTVLLAQPSTGRREYISFKRDKFPGFEIWIIGTDGHDEKKLLTVSEDRHGYDGIWVSPTNFVYRKGDDLWLLDINAPKKTRRITFDSKLSDGTTNHFGETCHCVFYASLMNYNPTRQEVYYDLSDMPCSDPNIYCALDMLSMKSRVIPIPSTWQDYITDTRGDWIFGNNGATPSSLAAMNLKTGKKLSLTKGEGEWGDTDAVLSPDGKLLAFTRNMEIYLMDLQTLDTRRIDGRGEHPMWSPDGKLIAFKNDIQPNKNIAYQYSEIYVTDLEGNQKTLVSGKDYGNDALGLYLVGWTQDGKLIWHHNYKLSAVESRMDLKLIDPYTKEKRILVKDVSDAAVWRQPAAAPILGTMD